MAQKILLNMAVFGEEWLWVSIRAAGRGNKMSLFCRWLVIALILPTAAFASAGIDTVAGVDLPVSAGGALGLVVTATGSATGFPAGTTVFSRSLVLGNDAGLGCSNATEGMMRYNSSSHAFEGCNGTSWISLSGGKLPSADCVMLNANDRHSSPKCNAGYYIKALIKDTNDAWDSYYAICCNSDPSVTGNSYNTVVNQCIGAYGLNSGLSGKGSYATTCPTKD
jgi:hypothetical protein